MSDLIIKRLHTVVLDISICKTGGICKIFISESVQCNVINTPVSECISCMQSRNSINMAGGDILPSSITSFDIFVDHLGIHIQATCSTQHVVIDATEHAQPFYFIFPTS